MQYKNESKDEIVLCPFVYIKVFDAANKKVPHDAYLGAGFAAEDHMDRTEKRFLVIPAGKTGDVLVNLGQNDMGHDFNGWDFKQPGVYKIELSYQFSRKTFMANSKQFFFSDAIAQKAKQPERLWNRAIETNRTVELKLEVKK